MYVSGAAFAENRQKPVSADQTAMFQDYDAAPEQSKWIIFMLTMNSSH